MESKTINENMDGFKTFLLIVLLLTPGINILVIVFACLRINRGNEPPFDDM